MAGLKVTAIKIDPYMNIDAGTMRPTEHGEVFVLNDGGEVDLDLGNYERYLDVTLSRDNNITTGKIYREVIEKEIVPHVTTAIQNWVERVSKIPVDESGEEPDICIIELGGTVGDIESAPFIEAMRQFQFRVGYENFALIHVSLVPEMHGEQKTKPTQMTVHALRGLGLLPDLMAVLEWARNVLDVHDAQSTEFVPDTPNPFIVFMPEISRTQMGGTMRLGLRQTIFQGTTTALALANNASDYCTGAHDITVKPSAADTPVESPAMWSKARQLYGNVDRMWERHRHRYEVSPNQVSRLEASGLTFVGKDEKSKRMQILELRGFQSHPELCSRPLNPSPPFLGFIAAACGPNVLAEQLEEQSRSYRPPHPERSMVSEGTLRTPAMERF
ncbi:hypothetical protein ID866_9990, partial [Astraeus odoratus]